MSKIPLATQRLLDERDAANKKYADFLKEYSRGQKILWQEIRSLGLKLYRSGKYYQDTVDIFYHGRYFVKKFSGVLVDLKNGELVDSLHVDQPASDECIAKWLFPEDLDAEKILTRYRSKLENLTHNPMSKNPLTIIIHQMPYSHTATYDGVPSLCGKTIVLEDIITRISTGIYGKYMCKVCIDKKKSLKIGATVYPLEGGKWKELDDVVFKATWPNYGTPPTNEHDPRPGVFE